MKLKLEIILLTTILLSILLFFIISNKQIVYGYGGRTKTIATPMCKSECEYADSYCKNNDLYICKDSNRDGCYEWVKIECKYGCKNGNCLKCEEKWKCSEWSPCINGKQTRSCIDLNNCGTEKNKPATEKDCKVEKEKKKKIEAKEKKRKAVPLGGTMILIFSLIILALVAGIIIWKRKK